MLRFPKLSFLRKKKPVRTSSYRTFIEQYPDYASTFMVDRLRATDYYRLDRLGHTYLDYTGGSLYADCQLDAHQELLRNNVFGNPHSTNPTSQASTKFLDETRQFVLDYFNCGDDYFCIFTANASAAIKIVGECFPFCENSELLLTFDNHNSINGLREFARNGDCATGYVPAQIENLRIDEGKLKEALDACPDKKNKLFAYPAQSNVSGVKHGLEWVKYAQDQDWDVLLDAAAFVPTNKLDLQAVKPNFVSISFYKMFGYPTGMGCLLMRKDSFKKLKKPWFAGGTVSLVSILADDYILAENHEKFEDGTVNYLGIPAIKIGLEHINKVGIETIQLRVKCLTGWLINHLDELKHSTGAPLVQISGPITNEERGGTIIMNFYDKDGSKLPFFEVEQRANAAKISLRTGCFCNPGIDELNSDLSQDQLGEYFTSRDSKSAKMIMESVGTIRGAIRISFGLASNFADAERFLVFAKTFLDE